MAPKGQKVGYIRVSSVDQNQDRQLADIRGELDRVFEDKCSGGSVKRQGLAQCLKHVRQGDTLYVHSIDRLARNLKDLLGLIEQLVGDGVTVCFRKENLTFTGEQNAFQKLQLQIIGSCAEFEREMIRERQREGIAVARAKGKKFGRKPVINKALKDDIAKAIAAGEAKAAIAHRLGIGRATLYRALG